MNPKDFFRAMTLKGIRKEGCAQIHEGLLKSNRLWIGRDTEGDLIIQKPGRIFRPIK